MLQLDEARAFGLELDAARLDRLEHFARLLVEWNGRFNLTSITDPEGMRVKHFLDSLSVALVFDPAVRLSPRAVADIGSGAGLPGIPLAIAFPTWQVTLVEATGKKVSFLEHVLRELPLPNARTLPGRAEELARLPAHREKFDLAVERAVAPLPTLVEYLLPFVRVGGRAVAQKGISVQAELAAARRGVRLLGGELAPPLSVSLPGLEPRHLVVMLKTHPTPPAYPRPAGLPVKQPL